MVRSGVCFPPKKKKKYRKVKATNPSDVLMKTKEAKDEKQEHDELAPCTVDMICGKELTEDNLCRDWNRKEPEKWSRRQGVDVEEKEEGKGSGNRQARSRGGARTLPAFSRKRSADRERKKESKAMQRSKEPVGELSGGDSEDQKNKNNEKREEEEKLLRERHSNVGNRDSKTV